MRGTPPKFFTSSKSVSYTHLGEQIHVGRSSMGDLLEKLEARYGSVE